MRIGVLGPLNDMSHRSKLIAEYMEKEKKEPIICDIENVTPI